MRGLATPIAIIIAGALVGAGLYFGTRTNAPDAPSATPSSTPPAVTSPLAPASQNPVTQPLNVAPLQPAPPPGMPQDQVDAEVGKAIEGLRQRIIHDCYEPHKNDAGIPKKMTLGYSGGFDPNGVENARGLSDDRPTFFQPVSDCARKLPMDMKIATPGHTVSITQQMQFP